jgi:hypothetical protein
MDGGRYTAGAAQPWRHPHDWMGGSATQVLQSVHRGGIGSTKAGVQTANGRLRGAPAGAISRPTVSRRDMTGAEGSPGGGIGRRWTKPKHKE